MKDLALDTLIGNEAFSAVAQAAGYEAGCEDLFGRAIGFRQCEICKGWGSAGEMVFVTDDGDLCEQHLSHFKKG